MEKILGLDISSSTIGWAVIESEEKFCLKEYGHIKPSRKLKGTEKLSDAYDKIKKLIKEVNPDIICVEKYASKFSRGRSSANTIIVLSTYNEMVSLCSFREFGIHTTAYAPVSIRSEMSKHFDKKIKSKDDAFDFVKNNIENFKTTLNRVNNIKKECYDESDAVCVALCYHIKKLKKGV